MRLSELQTEAREWHDQQFGTSHSPEWACMAITEEWGEVCRALLKAHQGIRGTPEKWMESAAEELGDVIISLTLLAESLELDLEEVMTKRWQVVKQRDWAAYPLTGKPEDSKIQLPKEEAYPFLEALRDSLQAGLTAKGLELKWVSDAELMWAAEWGIPVDTIGFHVVLSQTESLEEVLEPAAAMLLESPLLPSDPQLIRGVLSVEPWIGEEALPGYHLKALFRFSKTNNDKGGGQLGLTSMKIEDLPEVEEWDYITQDSTRIHIYHTPGAHPGQIIVQGGGFQSLLKGFATSTTNWGVHRDIGFSDGTILGMWMNHLTRTLRVTKEVAGSSEVKITKDLQGNDRVQILGPIEWISVLSDTCLPNLLKEKS